jgi:clan AA aspartic protease (TIGR02281 family)
MTRRDYVLCPKCRNQNSRNDRICGGCGSPLRATRSSGIGAIPWYIPVVGAVLLILAIFTLTQIPRDQKTPAVPENDAAAVGAPVQAGPTEGESVPIPFGTVIIQDSSGREVLRFETPILNQVWVAIPTLAGLRGERWSFQSPQGSTVHIGNGVWSHGNPIGIWRIEEGQAAGVELSPWTAGERLFWKTLEPNGSYFAVNPAVVKSYGNAAACSLHEEINRPGVFLQNDRIVGWSFGIPSTLGYLWLGPEGNRLEGLNTVDRYTISNSREAQFVRGLAPGSSGEERLDILARGFLHDAVFFQEDLPDHLKNNSVIGEMKTLIKEISASRSILDVTSIVNDDVLTASRSFELMAEIARTAAKTEGFRFAVQLFEEKIDLIEVSSAREEISLNEFRAGLYKNWIEYEINNDEFYNGWAVYETASRLFPDDSEIHLLGIEITMAEGKWEEAAKMLESRSYPGPLQQKANTLLARLSARKTLEKIVTIRFTPGATQFPVDAVVNDSLRMQFFIDTGATGVTIPTHIAQSLELNMDANSPMVPVSTAGGVYMAYKTVLKSISIEGLAAYDLDVLIIDLPGYPDAGLLGNSFLNNFQIEIDSQQGVLRLKKR